MIIQRFGALCLLSALAMPPKVFAQDVFERAGNIYFRDSDETQKSLTSSGDDSSPSLSPDSSEVVFRRELKPPTPDCDGVYELWLVQIATREEELLLRPLQVKRELTPFGTANFGTPQFSTDGKLDSDSREAGFIGRESRDRDRFFQSTAK
jgi:hypothetical protein